MAEIITKKEGPIGNIIFKSSENECHEFRYVARRSQGDARV